MSDFYFLYFSQYIPTCIAMQWHNYQLIIYANIYANEHKKSSAAIT